MTLLDAAEAAPKDLWTVIYALGATVIGLSSVVAILAKHVSGRQDREQERESRLRDAHAAEIKAERDARIAEVTKLREDHAEEQAALHEHIDEINDTRLSSTEQREARAVASIEKLADALRAVKGESR